MSAPSSSAAGPAFASRYDVVVVGGGNAAMSAALSARESGARAAVLECAPESERGGNGSFTAGAMRFGYDDVRALQQLMPELSPEDWSRYEFGGYPEQQFFEDIASMSQWRTDERLTEILVREGFDAALWLHSKGVRFLPYRRQGARSGDKIKWFGGLVVETVGGGIGLIDAEYKAAARAGIDVFYDTLVLDLLQDDGGAVSGVRARRHGVAHHIAAGAVVLASGGFEANPEWRARYLGPGWDLAKVRGSRHNQGSGIAMALAAGAQACGHWSGCHATSWERHAPAYGDRAIGELFSKHSYPYGVLINAEGKRFIDEGADFYLYTYAKCGRALLQQPDQFAWQVFDSQVKHLMHDEYRIRQVTRVVADSLEELVVKMGDVDKAQFLKTMEAYNAAAPRGRMLDPTVRDSLATSGLDIPKSNWAMPLEKPPFEAYAVTCGITFTYGGVKIDAQANVLDTADRPIPGLYSAGEMVGGIFYFNYPGGSGLTNGTVFGRIAGREAASHAAAT
jgi:tricarballylate dehydrogenase